MTNPYAKLILTLAGFLLAVAIVTWGWQAGLENTGTQDGDLLAAVGNVSGWCFNAGFASVLAWLVLRGATWRAREATDRLGERTARPAQQVSTTRD